jgi:hypothetical protein
VEGAMVYADLFCNRSCFVLGGADGVEGDAHVVGASKLYGG